MKIALLASAAAFILALSIGPSNALPDTGTYPIGTVQCEAVADITGKIHSNRYAGKTWEDERDDLARNLAVSEFKVGMKYIAEKALFWAHAEPKLDRDQVTLIAIQKYEMMEKVYNRCMAGTL